MQPPLFIDSGAHGLYTEYVIRQNHRYRYQWYESKEFKQYLDRYAAFIKKNSGIIDVYANVDVIFEPKKTWEAQKYLEEEHGLSPVPVIHHGTALNWLEKYLNADYNYIALGGLGQEVTHYEYQEWADGAFNIICDTSKRLPSVKVHGFAMTSQRFITRYPWYSVDSTSWILYASYGGIICPPKKDGKWIYSEPFYVIKVTPRPIKGGNEIDLYFTNKKEIKKIILEYIKEKGFVLGKTLYKEGKDEIIEIGLSNNTNMRCELNAIYFIDLANSLPKWPWPFRKQRKGLGI